MQKLVSDYNRAFEIRLAVDPMLQVSHADWWKDSKQKVYGEVSMYNPNKSILIARE